ncbi:hypothetical protein OS493_039777 [Desmophyllum pertusum]|uniref:Uncharacterized protein n=1 Tax=Desmophyllum pertusum TaxID=174260 RepID=A0A9W9YWH2_9CNID|nr:hypothetical protein OS493_039777 [Desmophyllum pertusum]
MSDRYSQAIDAGLLFYMKAAHMLSVPGFPSREEGPGNERNEVARYLTLNRAGATGTMPGNVKRSQHLPALVLRHKTAPPSTRLRSKETA